MLFDPQNTSLSSFYRLMVGSIVPRPIAWVSTVNHGGQNNLAPFSFFNAVCPKPPTILFCPGIRATDGAHKDTYNNIRATGEFVVNIVTELTAEAMNVSATEFPSDVDEFVAAGLTPLDSTRVRAKRVGESPVNYECVLTQIVDIGGEPGSGSIVIGRVVALHVRDDLLIDGDKIDPAKLQPIGRLAGDDYCRTADVFSLARPQSQIHPKREKS